MLLSVADLNKHKVRTVSARLEGAGFSTSLVERRFGACHRLMVDEPTTALIGVDDDAARRDLDTSGFLMVVEAGLGGEHHDFRNIRLHTFPGPRGPSEIWNADVVTEPFVELNDAYRKLAEERNDICGMNMLASRAVATPFVGALAAVLTLSEVMRPLHGGLAHAVLDVQMTNLRHRAGAIQKAPQGPRTPFVLAEKRQVGQGTVGM